MRTSEGEGVKCRFRMRINNCSAAAVFCNHSWGASCWIPALLDDPLHDRDDFFRTTYLLNYKQDTGIANESYWWILIANLSNVVPSHSSFWRCSAKICRASDSHFLFSHRLFLCRFCYPFIFSLLRSNALATSVQAPLQQKKNYLPPLRLYFFTLLTQLFRCCFIAVNVAWPVSHNGIVLGATLSPPLSPNTQSVRRPPFQVATLKMGIITAAESME